MHIVKRENTSSKYKRVSFNKQGNQWLAQIRLDGNNQRLGLFTNEKQAADKYNEVAIELFGEHACLNEISSDESDAEEEETDDTAAEPGTQAFKKVPGSY